MIADDRALLEALLRNDLTAFTQRCFQTVVPGQRFLPNWHIQAITYQLERCRRGEIRRLIVTLPPRNLKSICASVAFPAYALGHDPTLRIRAAPNRRCASAQLQTDAVHQRSSRPTGQWSEPRTSASMKALRTRRLRSESTKK